MTTDGSCDPIAAVVRAEHAHRGDLGAIRAMIRR